MRLLEYLVELFVQAFGITRPAEAQRRRVTLLLGSVLLAGVALFVAAGVGMILYLHGTLTTCNSGRGFGMTVASY